MKLVENGEFGLFVDTNYLNSLTTPELINGEINRISMGNFEPVKRNNNTVVVADEYINFLKSRKSDIEEQEFMAKRQLIMEKKRRDAERKKQELLKAKRSVKKPVKKPKPEVVVDKSVDAKPIDPAIGEVELRLVLEKQKDIIQQLLVSAKKYKDLYDDVSEELSSIKESEDVVESGDTIIIEPRLLDVVKSYIKDPDELSAFVNTALAIGLLGDKAARNEINSIYGFQKFDTYTHMMGDVHD